MKTRTLENGFRVVHEKSYHGSNIASIQVMCDVGSIHEPHDSRGSAHFIEHMCFKGTPSHPSTYEISTDIEKTGSYVNAFTDRRYTKYYMDTTTEHVPTYIHLLSDMLLKSVFDKAEYIKERDVVKEEMIQDADDAEQSVLENADGVIFAGSPYEYPVDELKYHSGKNALQYEKIVEMYSEFYVPNRMILSVCSANSFDAICAAVNRSFFAREQRQNNGCGKPLVLSLKPQSEIIYKFERAPINPIHLCIGFRTCSIYDDDRYPLKMLKNIISGSLSSRLFMVLREENGLTYSSYTSVEHFEHGGSFVFYAECDSTKFLVNGTSNNIETPSHKPGVYPLVIQLICDLVKNGITQKELDIVKSSYRGKMIAKKENAESVASYNAKNILFQMPNPPAFADKYKVRIHPITVADINACIKKYFRRENMVVSVVGRSPPSEATLAKYSKDI
jgi:predicted Zn-dependent peptidase